MFSVLCWKCSRGVAEAAYPKGILHWCWRDETRVGPSWTSGHAFRNPELASAEDPCARRARLWLSTGKSSVESQPRVCTSSRRCFRPLLFPAFSSAKQRAQPTLKARRTVSTDERMSPSARPSKIAHLTGGMPRSAVFGSSVLITLTVLHALPVLAWINVVGFAKCSHEA